MEYLYIIMGLGLLVAGGDYLVNGGVALARQFRVPPLVVGMTIVAFGTSAPELIVSLTAAVQGNPEIALGNVVGSNIANIGLILGLTALIFPIPVNILSIKRDMPVMLLCLFLFWGAASTGLIGRAWGLLLFAILIAYTVWSIRVGRKESREEANEPDTTPRWKTLSLLAVSPFMLTLGANWLVDGASMLAANFGVSERVIGVTVVAFGTSIPELVASVMAALKRQPDISIGNIIGSNLFNIGSVIGLTALVKPIEVDFAAFSFDFLWMTIFSLLLLILLLPLRQILKQRPQSISAALSGGVLGRGGGLIFVCLYIYYIAKLF